MTHVPDMDPTDMDQPIPPPGIHEVPITLPSLSILQREQGFLGPLTADKISVSAPFKGLLRFVLEAVQFYEHRHLYLYADVTDAVANGYFRKNAGYHYVEFGYFEDRLPFQVEVDEAFHFWEYPDIEAEVSAGPLSSAQEHFERRGYNAGRLMRRNSSLLAGS